VWIVSRWGAIYFELWLDPCLRGDKGAGMGAIFGGNKRLQILSFCFTFIVLAGFERVNK
jgi:hypothetical protein